MISVFSFVDALGSKTHIYVPEISDFARLDYDPLFFWETETPEGVETYESLAYYFNECAKGNPVLISTLWSLDTKTEMSRMLVECRDLFLSKDILKYVYRVLYDSSIWTDPSVATNAIYSAYLANCLLSGTNPFPIPEETRTLLHDVLFELVSVDDLVPILNRYSLVVSGDGFPDSVDMVNLGSLYSDCMEMI